ncbi:RNA-binding Musashi-like protein 1 isoform B [Micractinium conductrix]|uniref:RNA-binding Musashi-like protein 1 isoform B n=1 Tax=Micractinium conductrix TaxID=554055 RepID=A0A2P6VC78_9CHLO|nr:RNA-binding Musashi-like protein 1 isoform B [Micractinium conductrix]|eukprot:PSC71688.1 RNA-binding Musashi-like protein 1 isoform B [Micractinium conductrix]
MCRPTQVQSNSLVLESLQQRLQEQLQLQGGGVPLSSLCGADHLAHVASRGSGPRIFCGHVPPECSEELVKAHFSQWGHVLDVYFPKRKDTFRRRPFCFVTFNRLEDAQRALAESPMNICGIPIKQLNLVEDRADYYKHRHTAAQSALAQALQTLALLGNDGAAAAAPMAPAIQPAMDLSNLAALLSLEASGAQLNAAAAAVRPQPFPMHQPVGGMNGYEAGAPLTGRFAGAPALPPFANLPGFSQAAMTAAQPAGGLAMPAAAPPAYGAPVQPAFPPASAAALAAALAGPAAGECRLGQDYWQLPAGARSPFSTLDAQHASAGSSPPKGELHMGGLPPLSAQGSGSSGSASPDLDPAAANRLAMWQLQSELLAGDREWAAPGARLS